MARSLHDITQSLAEECYCRYKAHYERDQRVTLGEWKDLPYTVQIRWADAVAPTAAKLADHDRLCDDLREAEARLDRLHGADDRATARLSMLEDAVVDAERALPDLAALGPLPGPLVELVRRLSAALDAAHPADAARSVAA